MAHLRLAQRGEPEHEPDLLALVVGEAELGLEVVGELLPHRLAGEEAVERGERDAARLVEAEHLAVGRDGVLGLVQAGLVDLGHLGVELLALGARRRRARCGDGRRR